MRRLSEIKFDIEMVDRELDKLINEQSHIDEQVHMLDRRRSHLQKELEAHKVVG